MDYINYFANTDLGKKKKIPIVNARRIADGDSPLRIEGVSKGGPTTSLF